MYFAHTRLNFIMFFLTCSQHQWFGFCFRMYFLSSMLSFSITYKATFKLLALIFGQVGQMQLIRRQIANEFNCSCKFDCQVLYNALDTFNK